VDKIDRRRASLRLTAEGRKVYKDIEKFVVRVERELMAALDAHEVAVLRQSLDKLDRQLESHVRASGWKKFLKGK
jgi:DNA-binding MarR family transcriptional regulator